MKKILWLLLLPVCAFAADDGEMHWNLFGDGGAIRTVFNGSPFYRARGEAGIEYQWDSDFVLGVGLSFFRTPFTYEDSRRGELDLSVGWTFLDNRLRVMGRLGSASTTFGDYDSKSSSAYGLEVNYRIPIGEQWNIRLTPGWEYIKEVTLDRDTGRPVSNSAFANAFCTLITIGLMNGCGHEFEHVTIPKSSFWYVSAGVEYLF